MTTNRVLSFKTLDTVTKAGKQLSLGAATETELWNRPEAGITTASAEGLKEAVVGSTQIFLRAPPRLSGGRYQVYK